MIIAASSLNFVVVVHLLHATKDVLVTKYSGGSEGRPKNDIPGNGKADALKDKKGQQNGNAMQAPGYIKKNEPNQPNGNANGQATNQQGNGNNSNGNGNQQDGTHPGQGLEHRSDRANEVAQNVYKNPNLQYLRDDPNSPYYQGGQGTDENGQPIGNCSEINAGCTAGDEELDEYTGDEVVIIGSTKESLFYYHSDHLGSASVITDGEGVLREHLEY